MRIIAIPIALSLHCCCSCFSCLCPCNAEDALDTKKENNKDSPTDFSAHGLDGVQWELEDVFCIMVVTFAVVGV